MLMCTTNQRFYLFQMFDSIQWNKTYCENEWMMASDGRGPVELSCRPLHTCCWLASLEMTKSGFFFPSNFPSCQLHSVSIDTSNNNQHRPKRRPDQDNLLLVNATRWSHTHNMEHRRGNKKKKRKWNNEEMKEDLFFLDIEHGNLDGRRRRNFWPP